MTDYTKTTDFTSKDSLPSGDSGKIIRGAEFGTEFDNIETAVNSKSNKENPSFTGNITVTGTVDGRDIAADGTKLDTIETSADVTDTANVTAAGAVMDSELTDITAVKALNQGVATTDSPTFAAVTSTGNVTVGGTVDGRDVATDGTKLDTVETNADVTDTTNVTAAGALMDSEVTNLDQVKAFDSADYATAAQGTTADNALPKTGGAMTGAITTNSTFDGRDVATDGTKLDGIEASADVTDTTNVTAAGAVMDSELTSEAAVKALNQGVATTDSPTFAGATVNGTVEFDGLSGTGAVTVTDILDQDDMSGNSATALATQQSIKSYVDSQVATSDTLAEVLANGNATGGTDVAFGDNDKAVFGAGSDLEIFSDGTNGRISLNAASSNLRMLADEFQLANTGYTNFYLTTTAADAVRLFHGGNQKFETTSTGIDVTGVITTDGMTTSADINFGDNDKAIFGAGSDLQIYHDGSGSYIDDQGTGPIRIRSGVGGALRFQDLDGDDLINATSNGAVTLYHNNSAKIATTSTGIDVTGTVVADGLTVGSSTITETTSDLTISSTDDLFLEANGNRVFQAWDNGSLQYVAITNGSQDLAEFNANGDISFYEDTGTTPKLFWDASAESLGIGTSSPNSNGGSNATVCHIHSSGTGAWAVNHYTNGTTGAQTSDGFLTGIVASDAYLFNYESGNIIFGTSNAEVARIDASGNVGIGTDSPQSSQKLHIANTSGNCEMTLQSSDSGVASLLFGDATDFSRGKVTYDNSNDSMAFQVNNLQEAMRISSAGNVGIGTSSPDDDLHIANNTQAGPALRLENQSVSTDSNTIYASINFEGNDNSAGANGIRGSIVGKSLSTNGAMGLLFSTASAGGSNTERMRIDSSGNLLVGTTDPNVHVGTASGAVLTSAGFGFFAVSGNAPIYANRLTNDGAIIDFRKDGSPVGSIRSQSGLVTDIILDPRSNNYATGHGIGGTQVSGVPKIIPRDGSGNALDGGVDLGHSNNRFQDLYLSNKVHLQYPGNSYYGRVQIDSSNNLRFGAGANGAERMRILSTGGITFNGDTAQANALDDYEEGTWTPTIAGLTSGSITSFTVTEATYTKIGDTVRVSCYLSSINMTSSTVSGAYFIGGLPFASDAFSDVANATFCNMFSFDASDISISGYCTGSSIRLFKGSSITAITHTDEGTLTGAAIMISVIYKT